MGDYALPTLRDIDYLCHKLEYPRVLYVKPSEFTIFLEKINPIDRKIDDDGVFFWRMSTKVRPCAHIAIHLGDIAEAAREQGNG